MAPRISIEEKRKRKLREKAGIADERPKVMMLSQEGAMVPVSEEHDREQQKNAEEISSSAVSTSNSVREKADSSSGNASGWNRVKQVPTLPNTVPKTAKC